MRIGNNRAAKSIMRFVFRPIGAKIILITPNSQTHAMSWVGEERAYFFGEDGMATVTNPPQVDGQLFSISAFRGLSEMWLRADDLLTEKGSDELAQANSQLSLFFAGRDFGMDILKGNDEIKGAGLSARA